MDWFAALWVGVAGGATMEAIDIIKSIKWHRQMPWNVSSDTIDPPRHRPDVRPGEEQLPAPGWKPYCVAAVLRLFVSGVPTGVIAGTYPQSMNPLVAYAVGLGALSVVQQLATLVPLMVKSAGRAAMNGVVEEAQQQAVRQPGQDLGSRQMSGVPSSPQTVIPSVGIPQPGSGVAGQQDPTDVGGVA
jgi:hypothetical protein